MESDPKAKGVYPQVPKTGVRAIVIHARYMNSNNNLFVLECTLLGQGAVVLQHYNHALFTVQAVVNWISSRKKPSVVNQMQQVMQPLGLAMAHQPVWQHPPPLSQLEAMGYGIDPSQASQYEEEEDGDSFI